MNGLLHATNPTHDSPDVVGEINQRTNGTEFYGTSSNYVLLNQLFSHARMHVPSGHSESPRWDETSYMTPSTLPGHGTSTLKVSKNQNLSLTSGTISVVNLLSSDEALLPPSRAKTPVQDAEARGPSSHQNIPVAKTPTSYGSHSTRSRIPTELNQRTQEPGLSSRNSPPTRTQALHSSQTHAAAMSLRSAERRLESELVRSFLQNLHFLHPMLDSVMFTAQCEEEMWKPDVLHEKSKYRRHFVALYYIVVAVGALVAGSDTTAGLSREVKVLEQNWQGAPDFSQMGSFQMLSRRYFRRSRASLGDVFEACSLESAQTLLLMV